QIATVGIVGTDSLPPATPTAAHFALMPAPWLARSPATATLAGALGALAENEALSRVTTLPPLLVDGRFPPDYFEFGVEPATVVVKPLPGDDRAPLVAGAVDVMLIVPRDLVRRLDRDGGGRREIY